MPTILEARGGDGELDGVARRLHLRFYWDRLDPQMRRRLGTLAAWDVLHTRQAIDVVIIDDETDAGRSVLLSARDLGLLNAAAVPALRELAGNSATIEMDQLAEALDPDLFTWLLWRLQGNQSIGRDVTLESISEISSKDRLMRGAKFTEQATMDRIEMAALLVMGDMRFGPAKVGMFVADLDAVFETEIHPDGGFFVYRASGYDNLDVAMDQLGHRFAEDMWSIVLPRIRDSYNRDTQWRRAGRDQLRAAAVTSLRNILPTPK